MNDRLSEAKLLQTVYGLYDVEDYLPRSRKEEKKTLREALRIVWEVNKELLIRRHKEEAVNAVTLTAPMDTEQLTYTPDLTECQEE